MRIGVLGCFYDCAPHLEDVLAPWRQFKMQAPALGHGLLIAAVNCQFKEYADMGYANDDDDTRALLEKNRDLFDTCIVSETPLEEKDARTLPLRFLLSKNVDIVWLLDGDEFYTVPQIESILRFAQAFPEYDRYDLHLKNYIFDGSRWMDMEFHPPRLFRTDRHGGIKEFSYDNEIRYQNGMETGKGTTRLIVPKEVAWIRHYTWQHRRGDRKVAYQKKKFGSSAFRFNTEKGELEFDADWYRYWGDPLPTLRDD